MSPNVTNNVTNKNLREEPKQLGGMVGDKVTKMMSPNVTNNVTNKKQLGGMVGTNVTNNITNKNLREEPKQLGGMVGTKYMSNASTKSQEFRQANMKQMSQSAQTGSPIIIMNNTTQQSAPMATSGSSGYAPSLPNEPSNDIWKSYINFAQRMSIG